MSYGNVYYVEYGISTSVEFPPPWLGSRPCTTAFLGSIGRILPATVIHAFSVVAEHLEWEREVIRPMFLIFAADESE